MAIKNIIARGIGFSPGSVKFIPTRGFSSSVPGMVWVAFGPFFTFTAAEWVTTEFVFDVTMRKVNATAQARLYDVTGADAVADSTITTDSVTMVQVFSGSITLIDGRQYRAQFGEMSSGDMKGLGSRLNSA